MCAKRMTGCPARCLNRQNVEAYWSARQADLERLEFETRLFPGDVRLWKESHTMINFKAWLTGGRRA